MPILIICTKTFTPLHLLQSTPLTHWLNKYNKLNNTIIPFLESKRFGSFCAKSVQVTEMPTIAQNNAQRELKSECLLFYCQIDDVE